MSEAGSPSPQGTTVDDSDPHALREAIEVAFEYRGDVTLTLRDGAGGIDGYIFDRRVADDLETSVIRFMPRDGSDRMTIRYADLASLEFTGRDTAAGRSWETWVRKYIEKKRAGEAANIEAEEL